MEGLSELFINGSAFEYDEPNDWLLRKMAESGYTIQELERILVEEVARSCTGWLTTSAATKSFPLIGWKG